MDFNEHDTPPAPIQDPTSAQYRFSAFVFDPARRALTTAGQPVALSARAIDLLRVLIEQRARVLSKQELRDYVWRGQPVDDNNLAVQISALRRALGETPASPIILTVPGQGYQFVAPIAPDIEPNPAAAPPVEPAAPQPQPAQPQPPQQAWIRRRALLIATAAPALAIAAFLARTELAPRQTAPRLSIAVLPFRALGPGPAPTDLAAAISDDLNTDLAHIPGSAVTARGSADRFADRRLPTAKIGRALNVRYLVDGSLRDAGGVHLIDVALIDAATDREVWSQRFQTAQMGLAQTQTDIVRRIASALDVELPVIVSAASRHDRPDNPTAEDLFYQAYAIVLRADTRAAYTTAQHLLEQALALQPDYRDALAELGMTLVLKAQSADAPNEPGDLAAARAVIARALDQAPTAVALAANARLLESAGDCAAAVPSAQSALALEPNSIDALSVLARCATQSGQFDQAAADLQTVLQLNPNPARIKPRLTLLTQINLLQGRYQDAIDTGNRALAGDPPPQPGAESMGRAEYVRLMLIAATALNGDIPRARALYTAYDAIWPHRSAWRIAAYAPKRQAALPAFQRFIAALTQAGMPLYANLADPAPAASPRETGDFAPTPPTLPGATTIDTPALAALLTRPGVTVLDLGRGAAAVKGAIMVGAGIDFDRLPKDPAAPVVVMSDGAYGDAPVNAIRNLAAQGHTQIFWYRGGEEAWAAAAKPSEDRRPEL